jgi:RNA polymerase sigma-70 factor (ECF subfamily)
MEQTLALERPDTVRSDDNAWADSIGHLFDLHHARLYRLALRMTRGDDEARDLVQECFVRAIESGFAPRDPAGAERWLVRVLVNLCRDRARRGTVRQSHAREAARSQEAPAGSDPGMDTAVRAAVEALPARQRAVVIFHEIEGRTLAEAAGLLGIAAVTARWHLHAALRTLKKELS